MVCTLSGALMTWVLNCSGRPASVAETGMPPLPKSVSPVCVVVARLTSLIAIDGCEGSTTMVDGLLPGRSGGSCSSTGLTGASLALGLAVCAITDCGWTGCEVG